MDWVRGRAYSHDLRARVLAASDQGLSSGQIAARFSVSISYAIKVRQRRDRTGEETARKPRSGQVPRLAGHGAVLRARVDAKPDSTLAELCAWLHDQHGVTTSIAGLWQHLRRLGITLKKSRSMPPSRTGRTLSKPALPGAPSSRG